MSDSDSPTTVPTAKVNLIALITDIPAFTEVAVSYGDPGIAKLEREHCWVGDSDPAHDAYAPYGQLKIEEEYVLKIFIHVSNPGQSQQEATERAFDLYTAIAATLRPLMRTATKIAPGVWSFLLSWNKFAEYITDQGYATFIDAQIEIKARI